MSSNHYLSRREFMELLGAGGVVLSLGWLVGEGSLISSLFKNKNVDNNSSSTAQLAYAQTSGSWLPVQRSTNTVAIHTALTRTGKIFYMAGSGWDIDNRNGPYTARLLD